MERDSSQTLLLTSQPDDKADCSEEEEDERELFEMEDSESVSDYDVSSDTELIRRVGEKKHFSLSKHYLDYKKKCLQTFSFTKLVRIVRRRTTDCIGGFVTCILCLHAFDCAKLKPGNLRDKSSGCGRGFVRGMWRVAKLLLDRKVFLSVTLYALIAFLAILSNEVRT